MGFQAQEARGRQEAGSRSGNRSRAKSNEVCKLTSAQAETVIKMTETSQAMSHTGYRLLHVVLRAVGRGVR